MRTIILIFSLFLASFSQADILNYGVENFCQIQAKAVGKTCKALAPLAQKNCYISEMEEQDFYQKQDFIIDNDGSIYCFHADEFQFTQDEGLVF